MNLNGGGGDGHWMEVLSRSFVILDLRFFGGGERACGVDERASGVGGAFGKKQTKPKDWKRRIGKGSWARKDDKRQGKHRVNEV